VQGIENFVNFIARKNVTQFAYLLLIPAHTGNILNDEGQPMTTTVPVLPMSLSPRDLVTDNLELVSLPDIVVRINEMVEDPECTAVDIAEVIGQDAALTARLLKLVNSPFYNFPSQVDTISMAITIVGTRQLRDLAMAAAIAGRFRHIPEGLVSADVFWQHNLACATAARIIAGKRNLRNSEQLFVAGLLHDIGKLVMYLTQPELSRQVLELAKQPDACPPAGITRRRRPGISAPKRQWCTWPMPSPIRSRPASRPTTICPSNWGCGQLPGIVAIIYEAA